MNSEKDSWDSLAKFGGVMAAGIIGSVFLPTILAAFINEWLLNQLATNPLQLIFACLLAMAAGIGLACSVTIPVLKHQNAKETKTKNEELIKVAEEKDEVNKRIAELEAENKELSKLKDKQLTAMQEAENTFRGMLRGLTPKGLSAIEELLNEGSVGMSLYSKVYTELNKIGAIVSVEININQHYSDRFEFMLKPEFRSAIISMPHIYQTEYKRITGKESEFFGRQNQ